MATTVKEIDPLDHLEERIQKAVALVHRLRDDNEAAQKSAADDRLNAEIASLREERQQVRARLEKLLGHIDQLGAA